MEIFLISFLIFFGLILFKYKSKPQNKIKRVEKTDLKTLVKKTFPKYKIIEKHGTVMICEISHRNEPEELVFIRINKNMSKNIRKSGRMLIVDYPQQPTAKEMKMDFGQHLN
ncbi:hypothetical protein EXU29_18565 [Acinetobacter wuhouensis]|uniref:hypothetical protein n=1 Tax=Acinetobacter wuhouensis TaxID=1879050 RepID=UPI001023A845|nr:hypothetical protein [Acinetobacter wuhouensis]RZG66207.1 hypothetical protein EXU29_18565 [Acinetobacter wuhouensis]